MKTIREFLLKETNCEIEMPKNAEILAVQAKGTQVYLYVVADSDPDVPKEIRKFLMINSGGNIPEKKVEHVGSLQLKLSNWGDLWDYHVFEVI